VFFFFKGTNSIYSQDFNYKHKNTGERREID